MITRYTASAYYRNRHVLITGGSTGLGRAYAELVHSHGARVSIISRNPQRLETARKEISASRESSSSSSSTSSVCAEAADVADAEQVQRAVAAAVAAHGPVDLLICCAGLSHPGYVEEMPSSLFQSEMQVNYMGCVHAVKSALPSMMERTAAVKTGKESGPAPRVVLVSSAAALLGFIGYAAYAPTKYAVRGLADALRNELRRHSIETSVYFPSSIDTPGYAEENKTKPAETKSIEGTASLISAIDCARCLDRGLRSSLYSMTNEFIVEISRAGANGVCPRNNLPLEMLINPILPLVQSAFVSFFDSIASGKGAVASEASKKEK